MITPRYPHMISVELAELETMQRLINEAIPSECDVKAMGNGMYRLLYYASESEFNSIVNAIEAHNAGFDL